MHAVSKGWNDGNHAHVLKWFWTDFHKLNIALHNETKTIKKLAIHNLRNFVERPILPKWVAVLQQQDCNYCTYSVLQYESQGLKNLKILQAESYASFWGLFLLKG